MDICDPSLQNRALVADEKKNKNKNKNKKQNKTKQNRKTNTKKTCYTTYLKEYFVSWKIIETLRFFVFERTKQQPRRNLRSYLVLQRPCNEAALSPGIDAFWY